MPPAPPDDPPPPPSIPDDGSSWQARRADILAAARTAEVAAYEGLPAVAREAVDQTIAAAKVRAVEVQAMLEQVLHDVAPDARLIGTENRVKTEGSLTRKTRGVLRREGLEAFRDELASTNDVVRFSVLTPSTGYATDVEAVTHALEAAGYTASTKNFWQLGNRFLGLNVTLSSPAGSIEVQFPTAES